MVALSKAVVGNLRPHEYRYILCTQRRGRYNEYRFYLEQSTWIYTYTAGTREIISLSCYTGSTIFVPLGALSRRGRKLTPAVVVAHPCTIQYYYYMCVVILICYNYHCHRELVRTLL